MKKIIIFLFTLVFIYSFTPQDAPNTFTDSRDGKVYKTVTIGEQVWMAENLAYLPSLVGPATGSEAEGHGSDPYYYVYGYVGTNVTNAKKTANYQTYGVLYNWPAAMNGAESSDANPSGIQGICPDGWHLPSESEWTQLEIYLGISQEDADYDQWIESDVADKLKETGTSHWDSKNKAATNESGFTALPGGYRELDGTFNYIGSGGNWWSSKQYDTDKAWGHNLYGISYLRRFCFDKNFGFSVRCLRD